MGNPTPTSALTSNRRETYRIKKVSVADINQALTRIGLRLDAVDGIGQAKDMHGKRLINVGSAVNAQDAVPLGQLEDAAESLFTHYWRPMLIGYGGISNG